MLFQPSDELMQFQRNSKARASVRVIPTTPLATT